MCFFFSGVTALFPLFGLVVFFFWLGGGVWGSGVTAGMICCYSGVTAHMLFRFSGVTAFFYLLNSERLHRFHVDGTQAMGVRTWIR